MSHEGDQVREWSQKYLQPLEVWAPLWMRRPFFPAYVPLCIYLWLWQIQELHSRQNTFHQKPNFLKDEPQNFSYVAYFSLIHMCPGSMRLKEESGEDWWTALFIFYGWAHISHTPGGDLNSYLHKGTLVLAPVLKSPNWAQTSVWQECAGVLHGLSGRTSWALP